MKYAGSKLLVKDSKQKQKTLLIGWQNSKHWVWQELPKFWSSSSFVSGTVWKMCLSVVRQSNNPTSKSWVAKMRWAEEHELVSHWCWSCCCGRWTICLYSTAIVMGWHICLQCSNSEKLTSISKIRGLYFSPQCNIHYLGEITCTNFNTHQKILFYR